MTKNTPKTHVGVTGKMSEEDAGKVGRKLANAALIFAIGMALAAIIAAVKWW